MRFRILDLFLVTTFIAALFGAYTNDLMIFRQALFFACTIVFATLGCFFLSMKRSPAVNGAIAGGVGGLVFTVICLLSPYSMYIRETQRFITSLDHATQKTIAVVELSLAPFLAAILGLAIGPLFYFYLKGNVSSENLGKQTLSWCFFGAAFLLMLFSMMDRLNFTASSRNWLYAVPFLLILLVVHTVQWVQKEYRGTIPAKTELDGES